MDKNTFARSPLGLYCFHRKHGNTPRESWLIVLEWFCHIPEYNRRVKRNSQYHNWSI